MDLTPLKVKSDYEFKLTNFEGPLDLLLHLIKEAKIDIKEIFVSEVTNQYLKFMEQLDTIDMEKASDFLDVAATLLEIKSNSLLPKLEEEAEEEEDPKQRFIRLLEEYSLLKEAGEKMRQTESVDRFYKEPDHSVGNARIVLTDFNLENMLNAFSKILFKIDQKKRDTEAPKEIQKDRFTLPEKMHLIKTSLMENQQVYFSELFDEQTTKGEVVTTFSALLEILKEQFAGARQDEIFGDIQIYLKQEGEAVHETT